MRRSAFLFFKGLGLLFAILCGIGTAILGWYDGADWMNIVTFSIAVTGLILWGWCHFSVRWIDSDLKQNILSQFPKKAQVEEKDLLEDEHEENFFFKFKQVSLRLTHLSYSSFNHSEMNYLPRYQRVAKVLCYSPTGLPQMAMGQKLEEL